MLWTALLIGLSSSLHCAGMCGPIALAIGSTSVSSRQRWITGRVLYNVGRTTTYVLLGVLFGLVGQGFVWSGMQQSLSIGLGILLLIVLLLQGQAEKQLLRWPWLDRRLLHLRKALGQLLRQEQLPAMFHLGLLNGLLPCGMVYLALAGALTQPTLGRSMAFMAVFGIGTLPVMLSLSLGGPLLSQRLKQYSRQVMWGASFVVAVLLILRGLDLGIPYLSPALTQAGTAICQE